MKRWIATTTIVLALGGCSATPSVQLGPSPRPASSAGGFVAVVESRLPDVALDRRDDEIAAVAEQACSALAEGRDADAVVAQARSLGTADAEATDEATARELVKLAIDTDCPDQRGRVTEF